MTCMLCHNRVADFARWKRIFDSHADAHRAAGLRLTHFWRGLDDPNSVFFLFEVADIEKARAFIGTPEAAEAGRTAGVIDGQIHFVQAATANGA